MIRVGINHCFYCKKELCHGCEITDDRKTNLEHVLPFDYISDDNIWNFTLACRVCNDKKKAALPLPNFLVDLIEHDMKYIKQIPMFHEELTKLDLVPFHRNFSVQSYNQSDMKKIKKGLKKIIYHHYEIAEKAGYRPIHMP